MLTDGEAREVGRHLAILLGLDLEGTIADRETLFSSIRSFIEAVAADQPTMLVFEDLHWADEALLEVVSLLASQLRDLPLLLLVLARPELFDVRPDWGGGLLAHTALPLRPLDAASAAQLAAERLAGTSTEGLDRAADLAAIADGNPLFIEQLAATMVESGNPNAPLPTTIRGIIGARLDALPGPERTVLLNAAVAGRVFWRGALERMTPDADGLSQALSELERRDLIARQKVSAFEGQRQYQFRHVLVRDVAYELLPRAIRRERHREAALFFEDVGGDLGEVGAALARHWRDAGDAARAIDYYVSAAEGAEHGWAKARAATLYREAFELVPEDDAERRRDLTRRIALAETATYHVADARLLGLGDQP
jgi:predicted ATPase